MLLQSCNKMGQKKLALGGGGFLRLFKIWTKKLNSENFMLKKLKGKAQSYNNSMNKYI